MFTVVVDTQHKSCYRRCFTYINLFNPHNSPKRWISLSSLFRWKGWGSMRLSDLLTDQHTHTHTHPHPHTHHTHTHTHPTHTHTHTHTHTPLSRVRLFATPWIVAHQAPRSMGFSRHEYWSGVPFPSDPSNSSPALSAVPLFFPGLLMTA